MTNPQVAFADIDTKGIHSSQALSWLETCELEEARFKKILLVTVIITLFVGAIISQLDVPKPSIEKLEKQSQNFAKVVIKTKKPPEPIKIKKAEPVIEKKPEKVEKKIEEIKPVEKKVPPKPKPEKVAQPSSSQIVKAREKAKTVGVVALSDVLADMRQLTQMSVEQTTEPKKLKKFDDQKNLRSDQTAHLKQSALTDSGGGISTDTEAVFTENSVALVDHGKDIDWSDQVREFDDKNTNRSATKTLDQNNGKIEQRVAVRDEASIRMVFDQNKGAIDALYRRALRKDSTLQGRVTVEVLIDPSGQVADCKIIESELGDENLEKRLLARISLIQFGEKNVQQQRVQYSFDFLPS